MEILKAGTENAGENFKTNAKSYDGVFQITFSKFNLIFWVITLTKHFCYCGGNNPAVIDSNKG
jgi:hypothetical protein